MESTVGSIRLATLHAHKTSTLLLRRLLSEDAPSSEALPADTDTPLTLENTTSNNCGHLCARDVGTESPETYGFDAYNIALYSTLFICMAIIVLIILFMTGAILYTRYKSWKRKREVAVKGLQEQLCASFTPAFALIARRTNSGLPGSSPATVDPMSPQPSNTVKGTYFDYSTGEI